MTNLLKQFNHLFDNNIYNPLFSSAILLSNINKNVHDYLNEFFYWEAYDQIYSNIEINIVHCLTKGVLARRKVHGHNT